MRAGWQVSLGEGQAAQARGDFAAAAAAFEGGWPDPPGMIAYASAFAHCLIRLGKPRRALEILEQRRREVLSKSAHDFDLELLEWWARASLASARSLEDEFARWMKGGGIFVGDALDGRPKRRTVRERWIPYQSLSELVEYLPKRLDRLLQDLRPKTVAVRIPVMGPDGSTSPSTSPASAFFPRRYRGKRATLPGVFRRAWPMSELVCLAQVNASDAGVGPADSLIQIFSVLDEGFDGGAGFEAFSPTTLVRSVRVDDPDETVQASALASIPIVGFISLPFLPRSESRALDSPDADLQRIWFPPSLTTWFGGAPAFVQADETPSKRGRSLSFVAQLVSGSCCPELPATLAPLLGYAFMGPDGKGTMVWQR